MPKSIIIKSNTSNIINDLIDSLYEYPNIKFLSRKITGEKTLVIKCFNYYNKNIMENSKNFYGNYIYLYTCLSLILSDLIIEKYEKTIVKRILHYNYFYFENSSLNKINNIINLILSKDSPIEYSQEFFLYRQQIILSCLLKNFRKTNYIQVDCFINFSMKNYYDFLEEFIEMIIQLFLSNLTSLDYLNYIIKSIFKN